MSDGKWYIEAGTLHITGVTEYEYFEYRKTPWFSYTESISTVVVHDDTTYIGSYWFVDMVLTEVQLHGALISLANSAFEEATVSKLVIPRSIRHIPFGCFRLAYIHELYIPDTVESVHGYALSSFGGYVYFESMVPPELTSAFSMGPQAVIYVPAGAGKSYKLADGWIELSSHIHELGSDGFPEHDYGPHEPIITGMPNGSVYHYYQGETARPLFVEAYTTDGGTLTYSWHDGLTGSPIGVETYHFTPPTDTIGQNLYYCVVTNTRYIGDTPYSVSKTTMADTIVVVDPADTLPDDLIVPGGSGNSGGSGGSGDSGTDTPEVTIPPDISDGIGEFEDSMDNVSQFEDEAWNNIHDNKDVVLDPLKTFKNNMAIVGAIGFVSDIVQKTFNKLGSWQVIITLPLAVGLILFIWSRVPGNMLPGKADGGSSRSSGKHSESHELVVSGGSRDLVE